MFNNNKKRKMLNENLFRAGDVVKIKGITHTPEMRITGFEKVKVEKSNNNVTQLQALCFYFTKDFFPQEITVSFKDLELIYREKTIDEEKLTKI